MDDEKSSGRRKEGEFPVDTLGIPILVDVVESAAPAERVPPEPTRESPADTEFDELILFDEDAQTPVLPESGEQPPTSVQPAELDRLVAEISDEVTDEIVRKIRPVVRKRVRRALRLYHAALADPEKQETKT
jgi:hypothetical protein